MTTRKFEREWHAVIVVRDDYGGTSGEIELTDDEYADYERIQSEFDAMQHMLMERIK